MTTQRTGGRWIFCTCGGQQGWEVTGQREALGVKAQQKFAARGKWAKSGAG